MTRGGRARLSALLGGVLMVLGLLSACSDGTAKEAPLTNASLRQLERDRWDFTQKTLSACMRAAGFRYFPIAFNEDGIDIPTGGDRGARYLEVTLTVDDAKEKGFGVVAGLGNDSVSVGEEDRNATYAGSLSPSDYAAYSLALDGSGHGCKKSAEQAATKKYHQQLRELTGSAERLRALIFTDPEFERISRGWTSCMAERGWKGAVITEFDTKIRAEAQQRLDAAAIRSTATQEGTDPPDIRYPPAELADIKSYEVGAAVDYVECFDKFRTAYENLLDDAYRRLT